MDEPQQVLPALYDYCLQVYIAMEEESSAQEEGLVYEGFLTRLITDKVGLSVPYFSRTTGRLKAMDCIRQLRRGGSTTPSQWILLQRPTRDLWFSSEDRKEVKGDRFAQLSQQLRDLQERVTFLEQFHEVPEL